MGAQSILPAIGLALAATATASAGGWKAKAQGPRERIAVIDLGPADPEVRKRIAEAVVAAGLDPVIGDGIEDALAGETIDRDVPLLAAALDDARRAFDDSKCSDAITAAETAIGIAAARQAAGLAVPELARAWSYVLSCADRDRDTDRALLAASQLRGLGVANDLLQRYPEIDALSNAEIVEIDVKPEVDGAAVWVDFQPAPSLHLALPAGRHVIAAAKGTRRGVVSGTVVASQPVVAIPMPDQAGAHGDVAARVASWHGAMPAPEEIGWVLAHVKARAAIIRHGDTIEAWGRAGLAEKPRELGGDDGIGKLGDAARLCALITDRAKGWDDRAPDPDQPLLRESAADRKAAGAEPTKWWVYATIAAAVVAGAVVIYAHDNASDSQRVMLHYP